ncbi:hypothetical protein [Sphingobium sp. 15-1]|uniref:hypothetical protein n=1 Tax=Sphingobium sp. 15-1 TaxID=2729616 RepID=UPI00159C3231|nr:hypothetical protein [Sphingobium sp. 15-1]
MGRSVSYPSGAHVAYAQWDAGWIADDDDPASGHVDELVAQDDWQFIVEDFREQILVHYPSAWIANGWIGREDRTVAMNRYATFGISEYCGCIAYWVVLREDIDADHQGLAERWFDRIAAKFEQRFATLVRLGTFSNGEAIYRRIAA